MSRSHTILRGLAGQDIPVEGTLSRVAYKDDRVRVVVFAFDRGQELTEHTAASPAIVQVLSGRLRLTVANDSAELHPGDWVHLAADVPHSVAAPEPAVMLLTLLRS